MRRGSCLSALTLALNCLLGLGQGLFITGYPAPDARVGYAYEITYTPISNTPTAFALIRGANEENVFVIATSVTGGSFIWKIPTDLMEYGAYYLRAEQDGIGPVYSRAFSISGGPANTMSFSGFLTVSASATQPASSSFPPGESAQTDSPKDRGLNTGAKAGIAIGAVVAALLLSILAFLLGKRAGRKPSKGSIVEAKNVDSSPGSQEQPMLVNHVKSELEQEKRYVELESHRAPQEVEDNGISTISRSKPA